MRYLKLKKDLYLFEQPIKKTKVSLEPEPLNHIWIYDRSYSMTYELDQLAQDLIDRAKQLPPKDTLTLGWFSSEGQFDFILKGFKVTDNSDYKALENIINANKTPVGCTCFSEILTSTEGVINNLAAINKNFALCFFTDGYPVVSNYYKEIQTIEKAIKAIEGKINCSLMVGYGHYYNKELLSEMATWAGGSLTHSDNLDSFSISLSDFIKNGRDLEPKIEVRLEYPSDIVFSLYNKTINLYEADKVVIRFTPTKKNKDYVYTVLKAIPTKALKAATEVKITQDNIWGKSSIESMIKAAYAASCIYTQKTKTDTALEVLNTIGDAELIDEVCNAFTNTEYGAVEDRIKTAMAMPSRRCAGGWSDNHLPDENAFSLLDLITLLQEDDEAYFYPRHKEFNYKRIGSSSIQIDETVKFIADTKARCPMNSLTWHAKRLNLSVLAKVDGNVELKKGYVALGFQKKFPTYVWRNYTLVKDGIPNMSKLPMSMSLDTFNNLRARGLIKDTKYKKEKVYIVSLDVIPVVNRAAAKNLSATDFCNKLWAEWKLKGVLKSLKALKEKEISIVKTEGFEFLTENQQDFLAEHYITPKGFSPKTDKIDVDDYYMAKEFEIKVKGVSSLPKVEKVLGKLNEGKVLTASESLLEEGIRKYDKSGMKKKSEKVKLAWFNEEIKKVNKKLLDIRKELQKTKFAIILGKKWFEEFDSRENNVLELDGRVFTINLREVKVGY